MSSESYADASTEVLKDRRLRAIKLHRHLLDADMIASAAVAEKTINAMDAELARREPAPKTVGEHHLGCAFFMSAGRACDCYDENAASLETLNPLFAGIFAAHSHKQR